MDFDLSNAHRIVSALAKRVDDLERNTAHINEITGFDAARALVGLGLGIQAGAGITVTKSNGLLVIASSGAPAAHNILSASHDATVAGAAAGDLLRRNPGNTAWERLAIGAAGQKLSNSGGNAAWLDDIDTLLYTVGDGTNVIPAGVYGDFMSDWSGTAMQWTLLCLRPQAGGALQLDLWKTTYALYDSGATHPVLADSITGTDKPRIIATATKGQSAALTGWTTAITAGDIVRVNVDSVTSITLALLALKVKRT